MRTATDHANELFIRAALNDDDVDYPHRVSFLAEDAIGMQDALIANMREGLPTVVVAAMGSERLLLPLKRSGIVGVIGRLIDRQLGRIPVVSLSRGEVGPSYATYTLVRAGHRRRLHPDAHRHAENDDRRPAVE